MTNVDTTRQATKARCIMLTYLDKDTVVNLPQSQQLQNLLALHSDTMASCNATRNSSIQPASGVQCTCKLK